MVAQRHASDGDADRAWHLETYYSCLLPDGFLAFVAEVTGEEGNIVAITFENGGSQWFTSWRGWQPP